MVILNIASIELDHRFKHPWNHHQFHNMVLGNLLKSSSLLIMMISTNFPIPYCEIDDGFMDAWTYDPLQDNSTDAIFKITIFDWSPL